jgi:uncharacterized delta-60 repeat protein
MPRTAAALAAAALAAIVATAAQAEPRELDRGFGTQGVTLTPIAGKFPVASATVRLPTGRILVAGTSSSHVFGDQVVLARYLPTGVLDRSFGGGDGIALDIPGGDRARADAMVVQPDGRILVSGAAPPGIFVARYMPDGSRDTSFGDGGSRGVSTPGSDFAGAGGLALQADGKIVVAGFGSDLGNDHTTGSAVVARLDTDGDLDPGYGTGGVATLDLGDDHLSSASDLVIQDGKAVVAGSARLADPNLMALALARLDENGVLDASFGDGGAVLDHRGATGDFRANAIAAWNGRLIVAGVNVREPGEDGEQYYVLARYTADGDADETFNPDVPEPGHVITLAGDGRQAQANGLVVDPATGTATITGSARHDGENRLLLDRFTSDGLRDPSFVGANGNGGPRLLDAGSSTGGNDLALDREGTLVVGSALAAGHGNILLARFGDTAPKPNTAPVARIRGHHTVPRRTRVTFRGNRSYDLDGKIVKYQWRVGKGRFHNRGPVFTHRFGRTGTRTVILRVTDDDGAIDVALFRVKVRRKRG